MDKYISAIKYIVGEQESIIGPVAKEVAMQVNGLVLTADSVQVTADPKQTLNDVILQYNQLFGQLSIEVSKQVIKSKGLSFQPNELPEILK